MLTLIGTAVAATTLSTHTLHYTTFTPTRDDGRSLATARPYPANIVDSTARPGFNGRVWVGREIVGGGHPHWRTGSCNPGPAFYGAAAHNHNVVYTRVNTLTIPVSPWCALNERDGDKQYERGRVEWLKERNYVGGVRTFVHPSRIAHHAEHHAHASHRRHGIVPRATIRVVEPPRFRAPIRVQRGCYEPIRIVKPCGAGRVTYTTLDPYKPHRRLSRLAYRH